MPRRARKRRAGSLSSARKSSSDGTPVSSPGNSTASHIRHVLSENPVTLLAALMFAALLIWQLREGVRAPVQRVLL